MVMSNAIKSATEHWQLCKISCHNANNRHRYSMEHIDAEILFDICILVFVFMTVNDT